MKMPEKVRLSVDLIIFLKNLPDDTPRRVKDLAAVLGTTENFLHQIVCHLNKAGMILVTKGPRGGVRSPVPRPETNLLDIYRLFGYMLEVTGGGKPSYSERIEKKIREYISTFII